MATVGELMAISPFQGTYSRFGVECKLDERLGLFATVDSSRFAPLRTAWGFLGAWWRSVDSAGDKAEPSSACSVLSPSLLTCLHQFG
jgi:hypothetical protein